MSDETNAEGIDIERRSVLAATAGGLTASALGLASTGGAAADDDLDDGTVNILHDTHFHGRFQDSDTPTKDIVAYDALVDEWRNDYDDTLFFGNGDELAPSVLGLEFEGEHMVEALNMMEPDAVGAGNHEFDFGIETAIDRFEESEFPWLVANLLTPEGEAIPGTERWITLDFGGITIGVFGLVVNRFYSITDYPEEYEVIDNVEAAQEATDALREEEDADLVICPAHISSGRMETVAEEVDGLDAIIGSHSGMTDEEPSVVNGTVISEFGDEFDHLARIELDAETGDLVDWERADFVDSEEQENPEEDLPPIADTDNQTIVDVSQLEGDDDLRNLADGYLDDLEERLGEPVVESDVELNASFDNYAVETGWGNLMTDIMRDVGDFEDGIDVATQNAGGIRSGARYGPGDITGRDVNNILPFPNEIEVYELEGQYLYEYLENQVRPMPGGFGAQPSIQVSGVSYEWYGHDGEAQINNVMVGGEPIDMDETYLVSTNDFEAGRTVISEQGELVLESGQFQGAFVMDRLENHYDVIAPEREHRMIRVDEWLETEALEYDDGTLSITVENTPASEEIIEEHFRLLAPNGETVSASAVEEADDSITAMFDAEAVETLVEDDAPEPQVRLIGGFDPDDEHYGYEDEGETISLPVSSGYDHHKFQSEPDAAQMLDLLDTQDGEESDDSDDSDADDTGTDDSGADDTGTDDSGADDTGTDDSDDTDMDDTGADDGDDADDADDDGPGFGPFAALTGAGGAAYLLSQRMGGDEVAEDEE